MPEEKQPEEPYPYIDQAREEAEAREIAMISAAEQEKRLEIISIEVKHELPGLSGRSIDSFHGTIENTKGLIIEVHTNKGLYEVLALLAEYTTEKDKYAEEHQGGKPRWQLTDINLIHSSARYSATFELIEPDETIADQLSDAIEKQLIDESGELKL